MFDVVYRSANQVLLFFENMRENFRILKSNKKKQYELLCQSVAIATSRNAFLRQKVSYQRYRIKDAPLNEGVRFYSDVKYRI